ncbi:MAG: J domain-containing protein [Ilumatobacteraceae bacterium]
MLLAEIEVWHTRPTVPTRRVALGHLVLPADPAPGFGGLLLGAVVAGHIAGVPDELLPDVHRLIGQVERAERIVQPRLRHRFQVDRHGLARSHHRLVGTGDEISFDFDAVGTDLVQVLGAVYAVERLAIESRAVIAPVLHKAMQWRGPIGAALIGHLAGATTTTLAALADPRAWALEVLGFPPGTERPSKKEVTSRYRLRMRSIHPDHGGDRDVAGNAIIELNEARRILSSSSA